MELLCYRGLKAMATILDRDVLQIVVGFGRFDEKGVC